MFNELKDAIKGNNDFLKILEEYIDECSYYVQRVAAMENALESARFRLEGAEYRDLIMDLDRQRRIIHDELISKTTVCKRIADKVSVSFPFTGDLYDRHEIATFAKKVSDYYFQSGQRIRA